MENVGEVYRAGYNKAVRDFAGFDYCKVCGEKGQDEDCYYCRVFQAQEYIAERLKTKSYQKNQKNY